VTNKGIERTLIDLRVAGIQAETFAAIVTAEDTVERKPHPAPILLGLERAGAVAADAIYVGDGPQDIWAARNAGMPVIAVAYGFYDRAALSPLDPDRLVDTPGALSEALGVARPTLHGAAQ
jgi:phosphoglycolate phosphatase-like HAD superfamily hydrolase